RTLTQAIDGPQCWHISRPHQQSLFTTDCGIPLQALVKIPGLCEAGQPFLGPDSSAAHAAGVQSVRLIAGRILHRTDNRTVVRFLRVDPQAPALMPPRLVAP